jgi:tetratricopeptide (TPR) repeat protein
MARFVNTNRYLIKIFLAFGAAFLPALLIYQEGTASAEEKEDKKGVEYVVGPWVYPRLEKVYALIAKKQYKPAVEILDSILNKRKLNAHERAMTWQSYAFIYSSQENFPKAIEAFEECLKLEAMPEGATTEIEFNLGQLYMATKRYKRGVEILSAWIKKVQNPTANSLYLVAMAFAQNKQYDVALDYTKQALAKVAKPQESWYTFMLSLHFQLKQNYEVAHILEILVSQFPKKSYWLQLAAIYGQLKREKESLAVFELAYRQKLLTKETEIINLASLFMSAGVPKKAAEVLEEAMNSGVARRSVKILRMQAESYLTARENDRAVAPLTEAAEQEDNGDLYVQLAQIYFEKDEWKMANKMLNLAINKGNLTDSGITYLLLGITKYNLSQYQPAIQAFNKAKEYKKVEKSAEKWINITKDKMKTT